MKAKQVELAKEADMEKPLSPLTEVGTPTYSSPSEMDNGLLPEMGHGGRGHEPNPLTVRTPPAELQDNGRT